MKTAIRETFISFPCFYLRALGALEVMKCLFSKVIVSVQLGKLFRIRRRRMNPIKPRARPLEHTNNFRLLSFFASKEEYLHLKEHHDEEKNNH